MDSLSKMSNKRYESLILILLLLFAFVFRLLGVIFHIDIPGDGPMHAIRAYNWAESPHLITHGVWLPGFTYLAGSFSFLVHDPLVSTRIFNLIIGTLTVPVFYLLVSRVFGHIAGLFSASMLVFLPLHVGLTASSLTEASFLFEIIVGTILLIKALEGTKRQALYLSLSLLCFCLAIMTRYEPWLLIPLIPSYYYWKTRRIPTSVLIMVVLMIFPVAWMVGNYLHSGDFLPITSAAIKMGTKATGAHPVDLFGAIKVIARISVNHLGWLIFISLILGIIWQFVQTIRGRTNAEQILYFLMICIFGAFIVYFAMGRGKSLWDRYLLFCFVMALPLAILPLIYYLRDDRRWVGIIIFVGIATLGNTYFFRHANIYITHKQPVEIKKVADWLQQSSYCDDPILLTKMGWQSSYLPLYFPECGSRFLFVSVWTNDSKLEDFLKDRQPSLLFTSEKDSEFQSRIEALLGKKINEDMLVQTEDFVKVYDIRPLIQGKD